MRSVDILEIVEIAELAGKAVMNVYSQRDLGTTYKEDCSPLTLADTASQKVILAALGEVTPDLPALSEESKTVPYEERRGWKTYWLIDPLDGTKEFIKRNGEFTVNIALVEGGTPVMGIVHAPAVGVTYYAAAGSGAFRREEGKGDVKISVSGSPEGKIRVAGSRSHAGDSLKRLLAALGPHELISMGSSLKFCLVADGRAHLYPRLGPTMEWDTAAAQCVVEEAGGSVTDMTGKRLRYNKENLLNGNFIVSCCEGIGLASRQAVKLAGLEDIKTERRRSSTR